MFIQTDFCICVNQTDGRQTIMPLFHEMKYQQQVTCFVLKGFADFIVI